MHQKDSNYQSQQVVEYRRKRRARDDPMERNYICNCGKSYLSYPALYTHMKNKHQGKAPHPSEVAIMRMNQQRPVQVREEPDNEYDKYLATPDDALVYVINTFKAYSFAKQLNYSLEEIFNIFPEQLKKEVEDNARIFGGEKAPVEKILDSGLKAVTIDWIFGRFVGLLVNKIDKNLLEEFVFILLILREYLNSYMNSRTDTAPVEKEYTKEAYGLRMLDHMNQFALYHFERQARQYRGLMRETCFINKENREFICLTKFLFLFSRWAFLERYTNSKIKINNF